MIARSRFRLRIFAATNLFAAVVDEFRGESALFAPFESF